MAETPHSIGASSRTPQADELDKLVHELLLAVSALAAAQHQLAEAKKKLPPSGEWRVRR